MNLEDFRNKSFTLNYATYDDFANDILKQPTNEMRPAIIASLDATCKLIKSFLNSKTHDITIGCLNVSDEDDGGSLIEFVGDKIFVDPAFGNRPDGSAFAYKTDNKTLCACGDINEWIGKYINMFKKDGSVCVVNIDEAECDIEDI